MPVWELLRSKLIDEVVFLLFFEHVKSTVQVLLDQLGCHCRSLFQVSVFYFLGAANDLPESPETGMTKHRAQVNLDSLNEILVIKVEHTGDEVVEVDAEHPDLLIVQETAWLVVKTILPKGSTEIILHFDDARVV